MNLSWKCSRSSKLKYAHEVIGLLAAYPGRQFKMRHIVRHVAPRSTPQQRTSIREGVRRVLKALEESGQVVSSRLSVINGADAEYWWKPQHLVLADRNANRHNTGQDNCVL